MSEQPPAEAPPARESQPPVEETVIVEVPTYVQDGLPGGPWNSYRRRETISAIRMVGWFAVENPDGSVTDCEDGWIVRDADGVATAVPAAEFSQRYELA